MIRNKDTILSNEFVHLHVHSQDGSLLDAMAKIPDIIKKVKESGMKACAITDHGTGYGLVSFYNACKKAGIKPILGCEVYEAPKSRFDQNADRYEKYYHLVLLVKNEIGYKNLCRLISKSNTEGFYYKPRIDFELLERYHEGLICLSGCIAGRVPKLIMENKMDVAMEYISKYKNLFQDDYYLEIQNHGLKEEAVVADALYCISKQSGIKLVCTNDCHYINSEDAQAHEWLLCLQTQKTIHDNDRLRFEGDYSVKTPSEMRALFPCIPEAFDNTVEVADKCNFEFSFGNYRMPKVHIPKEYGSDYFRYLSDEAWKGFEQRYPASYPKRDEARKGLLYELGIVQQMDFAEYFIDTRKTIKWARENDILVGPGRGSAVGSKLCYCLGITDLDPIPYNLLFERFLNPERISMPDIDTDYDYSHKDEIVAEEARSNGKENFAKIQTFVTMQAKAVVRDIARVAGQPVSVGSKMASLIPDEPKITLLKAREMNPELDSYIRSDPVIEQIWNIALKLEGTKKAASTHACGHIPTPVPCEELFPVSVDPSSGYLVCQYDMTEAESLGNLKKDLLMLRNLTIIDAAHRAIKARYGIVVPLWTDEILNDKNALALIASGETNGVFQLESDGMKNFMIELKPSCFEDIIAGVALYRPGPMDFIPQYIAGKQDPSSITYLTPELESILAPTYGVIVYQEQVMQIVQKLAGFSMGRADVVRKAMGKKKQDLMDQEAPHFIYGDKELNIIGCENNGISSDIAEKIWGQMVDFAKYAFNKSHAAAYAAIAMQTAYLKANYPLEFTAGLLTSVMDNQKKLAVYTRESKKKGIKILSPDINSSGMNYTVKENDICYGLFSIKNVGKDVVNGILLERDRNGSFVTFADFIRRCPFCNKRAVENLIYAGAFDFSGFSRKALINSCESILDDIKKEKKTQCDGQLNLFDLFEEESEEKKLYQNGFIENIPEYETYELLRLEKDSTGSYITKHPLDIYDEYLRHNRVSDSSFFIHESDSEDGNTESHITEKLKGEEIYIAGLITNIKVIYTKKSGEAMAFLTLEDQISSFDVVMFPKLYVKYHHLLEENVCIVVHGKISDNDDRNPNILADDIFRLDQIPNDIEIIFNDYQEYLAKVEQISLLKKSFVGDESNLIIRLRKDNLWKVERSCLSVCQKTISFAKQIFGEKNVFFTLKNLFKEQKKIR